MPGVVEAIHDIFRRDIEPGKARKDLVGDRQKEVDKIIGDVDRAEYRRILNEEIRSSFYQLIDGKETNEDVNLLKSVPFGTNQWSDETYNIRKFDSLCPHSCQYCYILPIVNKNFKAVDIGKFMNDALVLKTFIEDRCERDARLPCLEVDWDKVMKKWSKQGNAKLIMTPTSHDVIPSIVDAFIVSCLNILDGGHSLLITSKPRVYCVDRMCKAFLAYKDGKYKDRITYRFTLTTLDQDVKDKWEWLAPAFDEGVQCIDAANDLGFTTSVSMEPFLKDPVATTNLLSDHVTGEIWIGMMNGYPSEKVLGMKLPAFLVDEIDRLKKEEYTFENITSVVETLRCNPKVHWKESIINTFLKEIKSDGGINHAWQRSRRSRRSTSGSRTPLG